MRVHFVAVCGTGMGALAGLFQAAGHEVSGSDASFDPPMGPALSGWGVKLMRGFDPANLEPKPDLVVIGNVCRKDNVEARAAIDGGLRYTDMAHALAEHVLVGRSPLVVAGTHGKTTTSAMCAWLLSATDRDPGFLVGGLPKNFDASFRLNKPVRRLADPAGGRATRLSPFVVEGDEYDTAFFEKTPKMWHYRAEVAIVTSIEHDHVDIYPTEESYEHAFAEFLSRIPKDGLVIAAAADPRVRRLVQEHAKSEVAWFALDGDDTGGLAVEWLAAPAVEDETALSFDLFAGGMSAGRFALPVPGRHNVRNAVAAIAAAAQGYGAPIDKLRQGLAGFRGVRRRQELLGAPRGIRVYDDFAHHPTAVDETLRALRSRHPKSRMVVAFEPRSATACRAMHQRAYADAFSAADSVILAPRGRAKIDDDALDLDKLASDLRAAGKDAVAAPDLDSVLANVIEGAKAGDVLVLLSNGTFGGVPQRVVKALEASLPLDFASLTTRGRLRDRSALDPTDRPFASRAAAECRRSRTGALL